MNISKFTIYIILVVLSFFSMQASAGDRNGKDKKDKSLLRSLYAPAEPDTILSKPMPDRILNGAVQPVIVLLGSRPCVEGIDVSHYQGRIDWSRVAQTDKANYVYLKATEGANLVDDTYKFNLSEAKRAKLKVGSYHFFRANVSVSEQFDNFIRTVDPKEQDLIPIIDVEVMPRGMSLSKFHSRLDEFLRLVTEVFGKRPMIYTGKNFYNRYFADTNFRKYLFMIACYTVDEPELDNNDDYIIWQYTCKGRVDGVRGNVDISKIMGHHSLKEIMY